MKTILITENQIQNLYYLTEASNKKNTHWQLQKGEDMSVYNEEIDPKYIIAKAYKLVRFDNNGKLHPLYVKRNETWEIGVWYKAGIGDYKIEVDDETGKPTGKYKVKSSLSDLSFRPGLHLGSAPYSPHIYTRKDNYFDDDPNGSDAKTGAKGKLNTEISNLSDEEKRKFKDSFDYSKTRYITQDNIFVECSILFSEEDQNRANSNGTGMNACLRERPKYGYKFKTNTNAPDSQSWYITNAMRIDRVLSDEEVKQICSKYNIQSLERKVALNMDLFKTL